MSYLIRFSIDRAAILAALNPPPALVESLDALIAQQNVVDDEGKPTPAMKAWVGWANKGAKQ